MMYQKKAAFELSISTVIIIAIGAAMLILGLILVRNIFEGGQDTIDLIDRNVKRQINEQFNQNTDKSVVYLPANFAEVERGNRYNIEFTIRNTVRGDSGDSIFSYATSVSEIDANCRGIREADAEAFIAIGGTSPRIPIPAGEVEERQVTVEVPESAPLCLISYDITIKKDGEIYDTNFFTLDIIE